MAPFHDVKAGDLVVIRPPETRSPRKIARVERTTRTQFVAGGYQFRKDSNTQIGGDGWRFARVYHPTPELLAEVEAEHRYRQATERTYQLVRAVTNLRLEIDRNPNPHHWAATLEAAAEHLAAAVERLQSRVEEDPTP